MRQKITKVALTLILVLLPTLAHSLPVEVERVSLDGLKGKGYLAQGVERLLVSGLKARGLEAFTPDGVKVESGYLVRCILKKEAGAGLLLIAKVWRKAGLLRGDEAPLTTLKRISPSEEGLFDAVDQLSKDLTQFIEKDREHLAIKPIEREKMGPAVGKIPLKKKETAPPTPIEPPKTNEMAKMAKNESTRDYIPDLVPDLPPDDEETGPKKDAKQAAEGSSGLFSLLNFLKADKEKKRDRATMPPYSEDLPVPTPEEIIKKETLKEKRQAAEKLAKAQPTMSSPQSPTKLPPPSQEGPNHSVPPQKSSTPQEVKGKLPHWKWF